jgi:TonB-dependent SusC/RagA subfamily outer membrane receptor
MTLPSFATTDTKDGLKTPDVSLSAISQQSKKTVNGQILDSTGLPIPGANIRVKDSTVGTISDADGKFSLEVPNNSTLVISYIGYQTKEIPASAKNFKITLSEDTEALEEVVVVGYGTARKKDVSGSIANVKFDGGDITTLPNPNAIAALSSKVAGIKYAPTNSASGNNMGSMTIRGKNAIPQSATTSSQSVNQPLLIVDGVISYGSINEINTNDIQSIDVMKDASAAAIYGSRAANGVIIITTRGGQSEKPTINLNTS